MYHLFCLSGEPWLIHKTKIKKAFRLARTPWMKSIRTYLITVSSGCENKKSPWRRNNEEDIVPVLFIAIFIFKQAMYMYICIHTPTHQRKFGIRFSKMLMMIISEWWNYRWYLFSSLYCSCTVWFFNHYLYNKKILPVFKKNEVKIRH